MPDDTNFHPVLPAADRPPRHYSYEFAVRCAYVKFLGGIVYSAIALYIIVHFVTRLPIPNFVHLVLVLVLGVCGVLNARWMLQELWDVVFELKPIDNYHPKRNPHA